MVVRNNASAGFLWLKSPFGRGKYLIFAGHLKTQDENLIVLYNPLRDQTQIISIAKNIADVDLEAVQKKLPKGAIIKKTLKGLVMPYIETQKGRILIKN